MQTKQHRPHLSLAARTAGTAILLGLALLIACAVVPYGADLYDEGLIANGAALALKGEWPGTSYYAPYPPGAFAGLALAFRLWGVRLIVERWFAAFLAALVGALGYWLVSGFEAPSRRVLRWDAAAVWLAALAATLLLAARWVTPLNGGALALVMASGLGLRAALPRGRWVGAFLCGALIGAAALWRLDFGLYAMAAALPVWLLFAGYRTGATLTNGHRLLGALAIGLGALAVMGPPLVWILAHGGQRAADSLFWWPVTSTGTASLPRGRYWGAFLIPLVSLLLCARAYPALRHDPGRGSVAAWLVLAGLGFLLYALGRTHATHLLPLRVLSLLLAGLSLGIEDARRQASGVRRQAIGDGDGSVEVSRMAAASSGGRVSAGDGRLGRASEKVVAFCRKAAPGTRRRWVRLRAAAPARHSHPIYSLSRSTRLAYAAFAAIIVSTIVGPVREYVHALKLPAARPAALPGPRGAGVFPPLRDARDYARIVDYLSHEVPPRARLYCGTRRHDIFLKDDNLAYFLSGRESGTYFWCLDAAVTSTRPVQEEMARELEVNRVEVVLIRTASVNHEPNASSRSSGVHLLDDYLHSHYRLATAWDDDQIYRRIR